jgi:hypothetical protein
MRDLAWRPAEHRRRADDREGRRHQRDAFDAVTAVEL